MIDEEGNVDNGKTENERMWLARDGERNTDH
jgi:hypothetical protein